MSLQYSQPIIIALKQSRLWPLHLHSALDLTHASSGRREYVPRVDVPISGSLIPRLCQKHEDSFLGLRPGDKSVVQVSFRPYGEPYDYEKFKAQGVDRYRMLMPIGMQFLQPGEEYEIGFEKVQHQAYMVGDLKEILAQSEDGSEWKPADRVLEVVAGQRCRFRVEA